MVWIHHFERLQKKTRIPKWGLHDTITENRSNLFTVITTHPPHIKHTVRREIMKCSVSKHCSACNPGAPFRNNPIKYGSVVETLSSWYEKKLLPDWRHLLEELIMFPEGENGAFLLPCQRLMAALMRRMKSTNTNWKSTKTAKQVSATLPLGAEYKIIKKIWFNHPVVSTTDVTIDPDPGFFCIWPGMNSNSYSFLSYRHQDKE